MKDIERPLVFERLGNGCASYQITIHSVISFVSKTLSKNSEQTTAPEKVNFAQISFGPLVGSNSVILYSFVIVVGRPELSKADGLSCGVLPRLKVCLIRLKFSPPRGMVL